MIQGKSNSEQFSPRKGDRARLVLNGRDCGTIIVAGWDSFWTFGTFEPGEAFSEFAPLFGRWSLLMHEDENAPLHRTASDALADAERQLDSLHVHVYFTDSDRFHVVRELNIDGGTIEWREF